MDYLIWTDDVMVSWGSFLLKNQDYAVSPLPNTHKKQDTKMVVCSEEESISFPSWDLSAGKY